MPKRGERVAAPRPPHGYELRYLRSEAVSGWEDLNTQVPNALYEAYIILSTKPCGTTNLGRLHPLNGSLGSVEVKGASLEQWQYEVTGAARIIYAVNSSDKVVWITWAGTGNPKMTE